MTEFVKICPKCNQANPEYENICTQCQQFIGMEPAIAKPRTQESTVPKQNTAEETKTTDSIPKLAASINRENISHSRHTVTNKKSTPAKKTLYLEITENSQILTIYAGNILGQAHSSSSAQVQIPGNIAGVDYIHRQHCRFDLDAGKWSLVALDQAQFQQSFTNPTLHNQRVLSPEKHQLLANGDELQLSGVKFIIRLLENEA